MSHFDITLLLFAAIPLLLGGLTLWLVRAHARALKRGPALVLLVLGNLAATLLLLSLLLPVGEAYFRFFYDETDGWAVGLVTDRWYQRYHIANNFNVRDNVHYQLKVADGKSRITVIGDSFTYGNGIRDVEDRFANLPLRSQCDPEIVMGLGVIRLGSQGPPVMLDRRVCLPRSGQHRTLVVVHQRIIGTEL